MTRVSLTAALAAALVAAWTCAPPAPQARAQEAATPTEAQLREAERHFNKAQASFDLAEYDSAIAEFKAAYELSREPDLLFNIAQAYRLKGDCVQALRTYRNYLRLRPDAENRPIAEQHIATVEACAESKGGERRTGSAPGGPPPGAAIPATGPDHGDRGGRTLKIAGIATAGGGVLSLAVGLYFGRKAASAADDVEAACASGCAWSDVMDRDAEGRSAEKLQWVFYGLGAAALVGGGVIYYLGLRREAPASSVVLAPTRRGAAVMWTGRW